MTSKAVFEKFVPEHAVDYCDSLYHSLSFEFKIKKSRQTKLGDYRAQLNGKKHTITVNNDLNPYSFLITYIHEVAHLVTFNEYGRNVLPHGKEWKKTFTDLAEPILNERVFPTDLLHTLHIYFQNPKASSTSDPRLYTVLKRYDLADSKQLLDEIPTDAIFSFHNRIFKKLSKIRTRWLCEETSSGKKYFIPGIAEVEVLSKD